MALKISVIGTGYLGATHAACLSSLGFEVVGVDTDVSKVALLQQGKVPFFEPDLEELLAQEIATGRLCGWRRFRQRAQRNQKAACRGREGRAQAAPRR